jgi:hypothetical protein
MRMRWRSIDIAMMRRFAWVLFASACALPGCGLASRDRTFLCEWRGTGVFSKYATQAEAKMLGDRLIALHITSTVDTIPDRRAGTCAYTLPQDRVEFISDDDSNKRLRLIDDRNQGIGYIRYRVADDKLIIESVEAYACEAGRIELPINMGPSPGDCLVGPPGMR